MGPRTFTGVPGDAPPPRRRAFHTVRLGLLEPHNEKNARRHAQRGRPGRPGFHAAGPNARGRQDSGDGSARPAYTLSASLRGDDDCCQIRGGQASGDPDVCSKSKMNSIPPCARRRLEATLAALLADQNGVICAQATSATLAEAPVRLAPQRQLASMFCSEQ